MLDATKMTEAEICQAVAKRLETHGWQRFGLGGSSGPNCLLGACIQVFENSQHSAAKAVASKLGIFVAPYEGVYPNITAWNDSLHANAKQTIIDQLRAA